jgi:hypothetical protein
MIDGEEKLVSIGEEYDIPIYINKLARNCELKVFDENENTYTILKIGTSTECIKAAFAYENEAHKNEEWVTPKRTYYLGAQAYGIYASYELHIDFTEFHKHY